MAIGHFGEEGDEYERIDPDVMRQMQEAAKRLEELKEPEEPEDTR